nr:twin transmembrane helix small protein [Methylobacterium goesingense]
MGGNIPRPDRTETDAVISSNTLVLLACVAVAVVLVLGLFNMMRGGSANLSQKLMRLRVLLQFLAIIFIMGVVWWRSA